MVCYENEGKEGVFFFWFTMEPMRFEPMTSCMLPKPLTTRPILVASMKVLTFKN